MKRTVSLLFIVLLIFVGVAITTVAACEDPENDDNCFCDVNQPKIVSVLDLGDFTIDEAITDATPYWMFIIGGKNDKKQLLEFIKDRGIPSKQKSEWKKTLKEIWKKYPIDFQNGIIVIAPSRKDCSPQIKLTEDQQRALAEIGQEMGKAMEESLNEQISPQWAAEHPDLISIACSQEGFADYASIAASEALKPDSDFILQHLYYHYYNPRAFNGIGAGGAPDACESSADQARDYYRNGENADAFRLLGYSSHFLTDVGNPMHTGAENEQIEDYFSRNIHQAYEKYVDRKWSTLKPFIGTGDAITAASPSELTKGLAKYSNGYLDRLKMRMDLNFIFNKNTFNLDQDPAIESITLNCLDMSERYARGLVKYVTTVPPRGTEWIWSRDGWNGWQHTASWTGYQTGPNSEYGPVKVGDHGEHGTNTALLAGSTQASVWRTFSDPSGTGWNTLTFDGLLSGSDVPRGRWMRIEVNGQQVFAATALNTPPGNHQLFEIKVPIPQSATTTVKITNGQNPAWGPIFYMEYHSIRLSNEAGSQMTTLATFPEVPPEDVTVVNITESNPSTTWH